MQHCLVRCKNAIASWREFAIATVKEQRTLGVSPDCAVRIWFRSVLLWKNKVERGGMMTSREYLCGLMGEQCCQGGVRWSGNGGGGEEGPNLREQSEDELFNHSVQAFQSFQE